MGGWGGKKKKGGSLGREWLIPKDKSSLNFTEKQEEKLPILTARQGRVLSLQVHERFGEDEFPLYLMFTKRKHFERISLGVVYQLPASEFVNYVERETIRKLQADPLRGKKR